jgi:flagellar hook-basal body complex protein FliE
MNPLSALRTLAYPALRAEPPAQPLADTTAPRPIPFTELEKISPGILPNPIGGEVGSASRFSPLLSEFSSPASHLSPLTGLVNEVSAKQAAASEAVTGLLGGKNVSLHQTVIAMEEASLSFQLMVEVRNKLLESYQELMRMQI